MRADPRFVGQPPEFWANVRTISQMVGYTVRPPRQKRMPGQPQPPKTPGQIKVPTQSEIDAAYQNLGLMTAHLWTPSGLTQMGHDLLSYFAYRATVLNQHVQYRLMDSTQAQTLFQQLVQQYPVSTAPIPMNKQKGSKKQPAYFTACINMLIQAHAAGRSVDYDPHILTTITHNGLPLRTLARRVDGAFTSPLNPIAIWEIKEYYYTTSFGSRIADGVYESLLDGMELHELETVAGGRHIDHVLMIDGHTAWWRDGRSYLCRIIDILNMGEVDVVLIGTEIVSDLPLLTQAWVQEAARRGA